MSELRDNIVRSLIIPREKASRMGYKNAKGAIEGVAEAFIGTSLNDGINFFDRSTVGRGRNEISQGGETCEIRFSVVDGVKKLDDSAIAFFARRIIDYSNYNSIVDTMEGFYEAYGNASSANPSIDLGVIIGDATINSGDTPGSVRLDALYFKNQSMAALREKGAGFEDSLHYLFGNDSVSENPPLPTDPDYAKRKNDPLEVFIASLTEKTIEGWGTVDPKVEESIRVAVRRAVRDGLERGNQRANAINNINSACSNILKPWTPQDIEAYLRYQGIQAAELATLTDRSTDGYRQFAATHNVSLPINSQGELLVGLTRENYQEKIDAYVFMAKNKPDLLEYCRSKYNPFPAQPIPTYFIRDKLSDYFAMPGNEGKKPANFELMTGNEMLTWARSNDVELPAFIQPRTDFTSLDHAATQASMFDDHIKLSELEIEKLQRHKGLLTQQTTELKESLSYWATKYGDSLSFDQLRRAANADNLIKTVLEAEKRRIVGEIAKTRSPVEKAKLSRELGKVEDDIRVVTGAKTEPQTRIHGGKKFSISQPSSMITAIINNDSTSRAIDSDVAAWMSYSATLRENAPKNDALIVMACCSILYDLNLNKLGGEIISANDVLERIGYDRAAGGIQYNPEQQKQVLSILNNLHYLNREQEVNTSNGGTLKNDISTVRHYVYAIVNHYTPPNGTFNFEQLKEQMDVLGNDPNSPFFGRGAELFEQMTVALSAEREGYAINNFNPVKACYAQMDPKLKDLNYRKSVMDYYKKEGLLPAKAVKINKVTFVLEDEYKPGTVIDRPPVEPPPEKNPDKLDYCREIVEMLDCKRSHLTGARTQAIETVFGEVLESEYFAGQRESYTSARAWFNSLVGKDEMFRQVQEVLKSGLDRGLSVKQIMAELKTADPKHPALKYLKPLGDDQTLQFVVRLCPGLIGDLDKTSLGKYYRQIQLYNAEIDKLIAGEPTSLSLEQLALMHDSLKVGADYKAGRSNSIYPQLMNRGIKLVFSQLNESQICGAVGTGDARKAVFDFKLKQPDGSYRNVTPGEYLAQYRKLAVAKEIEFNAILNSKTYAMFKDFLTVQVVDGQIIIKNDLVHGDRRGGKRVNPFDKPEGQKDSIGSVTRTPASLKPGQSVYMLDEKGSLVEVPTETYQSMYAENPKLPSDLVQVAEGKFVSISNIGAINDLAISSIQELKRRKEAEIAAEVGAAGIPMGFAEPVVVEAQHTGDLPTPDPVVNEDEPPTSGGDGM